MPTARTPGPRGTALRAAAVSVALCLALACTAQPASFSEIDLETARDLVERAILVEAVEPGAPASGVHAPAIRWEVGPDPSPSIPEALGGAAPRAEPLLIVASSRSVGYRSAAALARGGNGDVVLVIVDSAEDRRTLYAGAHDREETALDRDS